MKTILIWGFLGSGKTTFINYMIHSVLKDKQVVVLENESGKESIDGVSLKSQGISVVDLKAGCICCSLRSELPQTVRYIESEFAPDYLLIEPSGLSSLEELLKMPGLHIDVLLTLVDMEQFSFLMKLNPEYYKRQFNLSSCIVVTKRDRLLDNSIEKFSEALHILSPMSKLITTDYHEFSNDDWRKILQEKENGFINIVSLLQKLSIPAFEVETFFINKLFCFSCIESFVNETKNLMPGLIRAKGFLREMGGSYLKVDYVNDNWTIEQMPSTFYVNKCSLSFWCEPDKKEILSSWIERLCNDSFVVPCHMVELSIDNREIYSYMGLGETEPNEYLYEFIAKLKAEAINIGRPMFGYRFVEGKRIDKDTIEIEEIMFEPDPIISHAYKKSERFLILVATVGEELDKWIHNKRDDGDVMESFIADAIGSTIAEAIVAYALNYFESTLFPSGLKITNSYSPGYCGWSVSEQKKLFALLPHGFCGITLTDSSLMLPIKSVSAVIGVGKEVMRKEYGCAICQKRDCYKRRLKA